MSCICLHVQLYVNDQLISSQTQGIINPKGNLVVVYDARWLKSMFRNFTLISFKPFTIACKGSSGEITSVSTQRQMIHASLSHKRPSEMWPYYNKYTKLNRESSKQTGCLQMSGANTGHIWTWTNVRGCGSSCVTNKK